MSELRRMQALHEQAAWSVILAIATLRWRKPDYKVSAAFERATHP